MSVLAPRLHRVWRAGRAYRHDAPGVRAAPQWLSDQHFVDLIGIVNLIPGPNSTELAIYLGYQRAGWPGMIIAGACFIGPAMLIVMALAWAYVHFGALPATGWLLYGVLPVVIAIIAWALWGLSRTVVRMS